MKKIFNVKGMHCKSCDMLVTDSLMDEEGIKDASSDHSKGTVSVEYDEKKIDDNKIKLLIKNEGFECK